VLHSDARSHTLSGFCFASIQYCNIVVTRKFCHPITSFLMHSLRLVPRTYSILVGYLYNEKCIRNLDVQKLKRKNCLFLLTISKIEYMFIVSIKSK
jgi:hypothetical protein